MGEDMYPRYPFRYANYLFSMVNTFSKDPKQFEYIMYNLVFTSWGPKSFFLLPTNDNQLYFTNLIPYLETLDQFQRRKKNKNKVNKSAR